MTPRRSPGLYEELITLRVQGLLHELRANGVESRVEGVDPAEAAQVLARFLHDLLQPAFELLPAEGRLEHQVRLVNEIVALLARRLPELVARDDSVAEPARQLLALLEARGPGLSAAREVPRPGIPLSSSALLVNAPREHSVGSEIRLELASADRVDLLVSFLKWNGLRLMREPLSEFLNRRPGQLRVLTTTYMGATDRRVLDELHRLGATVKVSYDTRRTRLHAKAWLFHRESGFSTAFIGSSNLSASALVDGVEWNVRLSRVDNPQILERFQTVFEHYWQEGEFERYEPERDADRFDHAVELQSGGGAERLRAFLEVRPLRHQEVILDRLLAERERGHTRNLVVAATGTGKTVVAALDFRRLLEDVGPLSLLFVAHRREILDQSLETFRAVLRDGGFGERLYAGRIPERGAHVFASIQSLSQERLEDLDAAHYDVVIVDEFHHAAAPTYERLLEHLRPRYLLGLTATPERTDGQSILGWFDHRVASELRLWDALDEQLLCPFHYFGVADGTDLRHLSWHRGRYVDSELERLYTGDSARVTRVLRAVEETVSDPSAMRAIGFCVSVGHAEFMAREFTRAGIRAEALTVNTPAQVRDSALRRLRTRELSVVFAVDIFNEGVDVPEVDTVLFLRPTESATVFLQQLGRGLRLAQGKECLTALDFVGHMHRRFRFDRRLRALLGGTRRHIQHQVESGFPQLPPGCAITLQREARQAVLANIRETLGAGWNALVEDLSAMTGEVTLRCFLHESGSDLAELYPGGEKGWTLLRRRAGVPLPEPGAHETRFARAVGRLLHVTDDRRIEAWRHLLDSVAVPDRLDLDSPDHRLLLMLAAGLERRPGVGEAPAILREFLRHGPLREELYEVLGLLRDESRRPLRALDLPLRAPLLLHAEYQIGEITAALRVISDKGAVVEPQAGVLWHRPARCDLLFVTLEKSEKHYSPTTMYRDYPLSNVLFHWQSQGVTREASDTGQRYIRHAQLGTRVLLFVRRTRTDDRGQTMAYTFLGPVTYVSHEGERPMSITWRLQHPMPAEMFAETKVAAG